MAKRSKPLVFEHLENISREALEKYPRLIKDYVKGKQGVYALYRGDRLKYVGLASNLRGRLRRHLSDRHSQSWDKFSVFLTHDDDHLRELEALVIRIAAPKENRQKGKFAKSENLLPHFRAQISRHQKRELQWLTGEWDDEADEVRIRPVKKGTRIELKGKKPIMADYTNKNFRIRADYKGKTYNAKVRKNGRIYYNGELYNSPSWAGSAVKGGQACDGWLFWKYRNDKGEWVSLDKLRK